MSARNKVGMLIAALLVIAAVYYFLSTERSEDLVLVGTVDANQVIVSPQISGRIQKLTVKEGSRVDQGDLIALLDTTELLAQQRAAAAAVRSLRSQVSASRAREELAWGETSSNVANARAMLQSVRSQREEAQAELERVRADHKRIVSLAEQGVASQQDRERADAELKAAVAKVQALKDQVRAAEAALEAAVARIQQAHAAQSTVAATKAQQSQAAAEQAEAQTRLSYGRITAPVSGTVSVRVARQGEVVSPGSPIVTIVDLNDTWVQAYLPETFSDRIQLGDELQVRVPSGRTLEGKVFFKAAESDFATQRDVSRRKRDIKTVELRVRIANPQEEFVPGMTAEVLVPRSKLTGTRAQNLAEKDGR